ncbi:hypothetical protein QOZ80_6AG0517390 [Eleusine coracana subsp. coracana]|nr:hypothetical protein QOZ80_6AG0517390 [Eleusine coracana subsp. coracana]
MLDRYQKLQTLQPAEPGAAEGGGEGGGGNVDRVLYRNLVEMVPLVESLMKDRRANPAYSRRASMVYTTAPAKKASDLKSVKTPQSVSAKQRRDPGPGDTVKKCNLDLNGENGSIAALSLSGADNKPKDEMAVLHEQIDELQKKLLEKEEGLRSAESLVSEMNEAYSTIDVLRRQVADKESLIRSINSQLQDAKIILADKQASLEKLEWEYTIVA